MMRGTVNPRLEAVVRLTLRGPDGTTRKVDAVIDSGFSGSLTLPAPTIATLGLALHSMGSAVLADGSAPRFGYYIAEVEWNGQWRPVLVSDLGIEALVGMRLMAGHELRIAVVVGGVVEVVPLP